METMKLFWTFLVVCSISSSQTIDLAHQVLEEIMTESCKERVSALYFLDSFKKFCFFSTKTLSPHAGLEDGLRFFTNTAKRIPGLSASLVTDLVQTTKETVSLYMRPTLRLKYGNSTNALDLYREGIQNCLVTGLSSQFDLFKKDPNLVLNQLALELAAYYQEGLAIETVRQTVVRLIDLSLNKTVWSLHDQEKTWGSVKTIANLIVSLIDDDIIINIADMDDLLWTLTERYALFLELVGSGLSDQSCLLIENDLNQKDCIFAFINEQNSCMYSKVDRLKTALNKAYEAKNSFNVG